MAARKVRVRVERRFIDRHTGDAHEVGEVMDVTAKRLAEIRSVDESLVSEQHARPANENE